MRMAPEFTQGKSERAKEIRSNYLLEGHSRVSTCSFPIRQMPETTVFRFDDYDGDFRFIKNCNYLRILYHV